MKGTTESNSRASLPLRALAVAAALWAPTAFADPCPAGTPAGITNCVFTTTSALQDTTCGGNRSTTNCTAAEFTVNPQVSSNTVTSCINGQTLTIDVVVGLYGNNADRYNVGFFVGQQGNDPHLSTAGNICSAAVFPATPAPWFEAGAPGVGCGDYSSTNSNTTETLNDVLNVKVACVGDGSGHLLIPFLLTYQQNSNGTCSDASNVVNGTSSKCNFGNLPATNVTVTPSADLSIVKTISSIDNGVITFSLVISNAGPDPANGASYDDQVIALFTGVQATCGSETGGASCGSQPTVGAYDGTNGTDVSGTITTLPSGGSVTLTITGNFTPGATDQFCNTGTTDVPAGTVDTDTTNNTSTACSALPVKLQHFDVK